LKLCAALALALCAAPAPGAQTSDTAAALRESLSSSRNNNSQTNASEGRANTFSYGFNADAQLALSSPDYRVTAGDIYTLAYTALGNNVEYVVPVDSSYRIRVANLGVVDGAGKTFPR
jgi:hypothetical protein